MLKDTISDVAGKTIEEDAKRYFQIKTGRVKSSKIFTILSNKSKETIRDFAEKTLKDTVLHELHMDHLFTDKTFKRYLFMAKLPGVTDDEGVSAQKTYSDYFNLSAESGEQFIFTGELYYIEQPLNDPALQILGNDMLGNPLINYIKYGIFSGRVDYIPTVKIQTKIQTHIIDIDKSDEELLELSKTMLLSLDQVEMRTIKDHYLDENTQKIRRELGMSENPTDCELEVLGQTWSEHCKHKEFNAMIHYKDLDTGEEKDIDSLFKSYIFTSTKIIRERFEKGGNDWILKVFNDNAGIVKIDDNNVFIWKVETHNSPSALDPYGGALTGIVGVNRDPMGTGIGGGKCLFNTNVLCFGSPYYDGELLKGQLHPRRIMAGVVKGIEDGGNKSGIPTINGSIVFDNRFRGKPLVYCGTAAVMPMYYKGKPSWEKPIDVGDRIIMAGGRIGKDGIHGATFSSLEIDEHSPRSAVQIGSPITQKNMSDFMEKAAQSGLLKSSTDNGAGGLSSSIGELAQISGGAVVKLDKAPLKYHGLQPWEIFVSESQERMTFVVEAENEDVLFNMAKDFEVEVSDIGYFTDNGFLDILYNDERVAYLDLDFLHNAVPKKIMYAEWQAPKLSEPTVVDVDYNDILLTLMGSLNICSKESVIRVFDHEVKGKTVIKPLMGDRGLAPQDAGVIRIDHDSFTGIAVSNGIIPRYGDIDAYEMSAGSFDEAVRQIIAVGGKLPDPNEPDGIFWTVNDNFCVPDSLYNEEKNPDGKYKLAQLVKMNEALFDMATYFNIPMTSGKDSMKNDFKRGDVKISVPPTILYSMVAKIDDVRRTITSDFKQTGDIIYQIGKTYNELGGSECYALFDELGANVPKVRKADAKRIYEKMAIANERSLLASAHDMSDGGLSVALTESAFGGQTGCKVDIPETEIGSLAELFSESHSRFVVSIDPKNAAAFEDVFGDDCSRLGTVTDDDKMMITIAGENVISIDVKSLLESWRNGLTR
ncbi:MAG: phosphoribosylformylglycinamidine synthase [Candidatus Marinimicrobia bacterium]|nr:phosphoribosylformylglycinamidine synthase [Candidatus Neomarinimicrobiota bacterium]